MNTLISFHQNPIFTSNPSSWDRITRQPLLKPLQVSWKLHAQAKGFGRNPENKNAPKTNTSKQTGGDGSNDDEDDDDKIPQIVFDRMLKRILASVGAPMAVGVVLLKLLDFLKENELWEVPLWVTFITTFVTFGSSILGVAYGSLSTSWDGEKEGSFLGFEQAKENWVEMWKADEANKS